MTNNKWISLIAVLVALTAVIFWWRAIHERRQAEIERDRAERALSLGRAEVLRRNSAPGVQRRNGNEGSIITVAASSTTGSAPSGERTNLTIQTQRKAAIATALRLQRVRRFMNLEMNIRPKFRALGLSDEQWNHYQILAIEKADREEEAKRLRKSGQSQEEIEIEVRAAGAEPLAQIIALIGIGAYDELQTFQSERSDPVRRTVESLSNRLMFSNTPLERWQTEKLAQILRSRRSAISSNEAAAHLPGDLLNEVQSILTSPQLQAWRRLQREQQVLVDALAIAKSFESAKNVPTR